MAKLRTGSNWVRVSAALLIATPLALLGNQQISLVSPTKVEAAAVSEIPAEVKGVGQCGSREWPSPNKCDGNQASIRIITPTTTGVPAEALRAAEAQVAVQVKELMKNAQSKATPEKPLPTIFAHVSTKLNKSNTEKYARPMPLRIFFSALARRRRFSCASLP